MLLEKALKSPNTPITVYFNIFFGSENKVSEELYGKYLEKIEGIFNKWLDTKLKDSDSKKIRDLIPNVNFKRVDKLEGLDGDIGFRLSKASNIKSDLEEEEILCQVIEITKNIVMGFHNSKNTEHFFLSDWDCLLNLKKQNELINLNLPLSTLRRIVPDSSRIDHSLILMTRRARIMVCEFIRAMNFFLNVNDQINYNQMMVQLKIFNIFNSIILELEKPNITTESILKHGMECAQTRINLYESQGKSRKEMINFFENDFKNENSYNHNFIKIILEFISYCETLSVRIITDKELNWGESWFNTQNSVEKLSTKNIDWSKRFYLANEKACRDFYPNKELFLSEELIEFLKQPDNKAVAVDFS